jgi:Zn-dependent protease with chaperone function
MLFGWGLFKIATIVNALCFFGLTFDKKSFSNPLVPVTIVMWSFNFLVTSSYYIGKHLLYSSPHFTLNNSITQQRAHILLECAIVQIPSFKKEWRIVDKCIKNAVGYKITNGRIPYMRSTIMPTAFVFMEDKSSVFVTNEYRHLNVEEKALVMIHECAHIGLNAVDHAYRWQPEFHRLTGKQHYENADSFMDAVLYHCT